MKINVLGGGAGGLYFSILYKKANPDAAVMVYERNKPTDTFGWGVVFSDATLGNYEKADPETHAEILRNFRHWDDIDTWFRGRKITSGGHGFCGIARVKLLQILQDRAVGLGVNVVSQKEIADVDELTGSADLVVAADGINSIARRKYEAQFKPDVEMRKCRFIWLGTRKLLDAFTFAFKETEHGWFALHSYRFDETTSTFIIETPEDVWQMHGLDKMEQEESIAFCERLFADLLDGEKLISNAKHLRGSAMWIKFPRVLCRQWHHKNIVLIGDAAHTAHFSIGSGTKLAMEDAISLSRILTQEIPAAAKVEQPVIERALVQYQQEREVEALKLQSSARNRMEWFENVKRYVHMEPEQFTYTLLTGSQRIGHENLKLRDPQYVAGVERWVARSANLADKPIPPMFTPFTLRGMTVKNRVVMSPMAMYSCADGLPDDFYLVHLGSRALGGTGLLFTEMTCIAPDARITPGCAGLWSDAQEASWKRIVDFVHGQSDSKIGIQIGHAGRKGSTKLAWELTDEPLASGNWPLVSASPIPYLPHSQVPRAATREDMDRVKQQFIESTKRAARIGFDMLELHCAHGYLLASFLSPLTNTRTDEFGGSIENRCRYPLEIFNALRAVWPAERPMSVRFSCHDWYPGGTTPAEAVQFARIFKAAGVDIVDCSSGQTVKQEKPVYGRMYQTPFSDLIRNEAGIPTIAVGNVFEPDHVNTIIAAGRADLCALARPHLADPYWTLRAAAEQGYRDVVWPKQYYMGRLQLERNLERAAQMALVA
ncbi:MAG: bifunctional salicylyl-CoA 5-hydroxylase/oxidoreductase [Betaproteobacteria bacterium]|nr:bifunctional salicylyl-CoA 5-hydroxylase/oxidoreductase [Betaproteobacteria bacterium]